MAVAVAATPETSPTLAMQGGAMRHRDLVTALAVRLAVALAIRTAFAPDEFWQSVEVAHRMVFGWVAPALPLCCPVALPLTFCDPTRPAADTVVLLLPYF